MKVWIEFDQEGQCWIRRDGDADWRGVESIRHLAEILLDKYPIEVTILELEVINEARSSKVTQLLRDSGDCQEPE